MVSPGRFRQSPGGVGGHSALSEVRRSRVEELPLVASRRLGHQGNGVFLFDSNLGHDGRSLGLSKTTESPVLVHCSLPVVLTLKSVGGLRSVVPRLVDDYVRSWFRQPRGFRTLSRRSHLRLGELLRRRLDRFRRKPSGGVEYPGCPVAVSRGLVDDRRVDVVHVELWSPSFPYLEGGHVLPVVT